MKITTLAAPALALALLSGPAFGQDVLGKTITQIWQDTKDGAQATERRIESLFCDGKKLVWNDISDLDNVISGSANYHMTQITPEILQISWVGTGPKDKNTYVWTMDFNENKFVGVVTQPDGKDPEVVEGEFQTLSGVTPSPNHKGCSDF